MEKEEKRADQENDTEEQSTEAKSLLKKKLQYYSSEIQRDVGNLVKWLMIAVLVGCITGAASTLFSFVLKSVTNCRKENEWMFYLLPVMGLIIVYLYEKFGKDDGGTNQVLSTVRSQDDVPILSAPLFSFLQHLRIWQVALQDVKVRQYSLVEVLPISLDVGFIWMRKTDM